MRILTPGTVSDEALLDDRQDNLLVAINQRGSLYGIATLDISSGQFHVLEVKDEEALLAEVERLSPAEILINDEFEWHDNINSRPGTTKRRHGT